MVGVQALSTGSRGGPAVAVAGRDATIARDRADHSHSRQSDDAGGTYRLCVMGGAEPISIDVRQFSWSAVDVKEDQ